MKSLRAELDMRPSRLRLSPVGSPNSIGWVRLGFGILNMSRVYIGDLQRFLP